MKGRNYKKVISLMVLSGLILAFLITCEKPERVASIKTVDITDTDISYNSAILKGDLIDLGSGPIEDYGIIVSENASFLNPVPKSGSGTAKKGVFQVEFTGLIKNTTYYYKAYATINSDPIYGESKSFKTKDAQPPTATTGSATSVTTTSATLNGTVNANDLSTTVTFEYGLTDSYGSEVTAGESPVTGTTTTAVSYDLSSLTASTTYHYRVKAVSNGGTTYGDDKEFSTPPPTITDYDGNEYDVITIGTQEWIQENLKTTHYNNGEIIANITDNAEWNGLTTGAYCWYDNDEGTYKDTYGALYNWYTTVDVRNVCPAGWYVPTDAEWTTLTDYLGGESVAGGKLKEAGTDHWTSPNTGATNEEGFTALPGGFRNYNGIFYSIKNYGHWWSIYEYDSFYAWSRDMHYNDSEVYRIYPEKEHGFSIRCIKGELPLAQTDDATVVTANSATLNGQVNPNNASTTVTFEYGETTSYGLEVTATESPITGTTPASVSAGISSLDETTTYHYRIKAVNSFGTNYSADMTFTTTTATEAPSATTESTTRISSIFATLNGTINANDLSTTVTFEYGLTTAYGTEVTADESPVTGSTNTAVTAYLSSLTASTTYHYRVKAVSSGGTTYGDDVTFTTTEQIPDADGNTYNTVQIGTQLWTLENLKTTHYNNDDAIDNVTVNTEWEALTSGAYCWYDNDEGTYKDTYGALYNWYTTVDVRNVCPVGWHVPSANECSILHDILQNEEIDFKNLNTGFRDASGLFYSTPNSQRYWTSTFDNDVGGAVILEFDDTGEPGSTTASQRNGYSIRCIKGELPLTQAEDATSITAISATLKGQVNPNNASTIVTFEYGETTSYGSEATASESPVKGTTPVSVSAGISGLSKTTTYHYRIKAENSGGISYGSDMEFTTTGTKIIFSSNDNGNYEIYSMDPDGSNIINLTNDTSNDSDPSWSPDGSKIAFQTNRDGNYEIYIMNSDGSNIINLTNDTSYDSDPNWSPDGMKIAFVSDRDGDHDLYVMDADGLNLQKLTNNSVQERYPSWSPDGNWIAISRVTTPEESIGHYTIYVIDPSGDNEYNITDSEENRMPVWSPDGTKIAYMSFRDGNAWRDQIWVADFEINGGIPILSNDVNVTNNSSRHAWPMWSSDGTKIIHTRCPYNTWDNTIWIMDSDGNNPQQITTGPSDSCPFWFP